VVDPPSADCAGDEEAVKLATPIAAQIAVDVPAAASCRVAVIDDHGCEVALISVKEGRSVV
jgi:hypothetical protein